MPIRVGRPVSDGVAVNGRLVNCGLKTLTPLSEPEPVKGEPMVTSELSPVYLSMLAVSREISTPPSAVCFQSPVPNL